MKNKWKNAAAEMTSLKEHFLSVRKSESISVHKTLVYRALPMVCSLIPEAWDFYLPLTDIIISNVCSPDSKGDYEKGKGRHYYCAANSHGMKKHPSGGYYKNGIGKYAKSARSMLEENYTMALTMYKAGFKENAAKYLARAIHMLSDICCLPHATGMTYFSRKAMIHKTYEALARAIYPDSVPEHTITKEKLHIFSSEKGFGDALNAIAENQTEEPSELLSDPVRSISSRLGKTEEAVAAMMYQFMKDVSDTSGRTHYAAEKSHISGTDITINIKEDGLELTENGSLVCVKTGKKRSCGLFRAAHRYDGKYTFSLVSDDKGSVVLLDNHKLRSFNPHRKKQFYSIRNE